jgi:ribonuclease J
MTSVTGDELVFLPLGGSNEIGMNLNAYGFGPPQARKWIIVDIGVTFAAEEHLPGVELILPDPAYLEGEDVLGIVLTHAHEDHIGAIAHLWPRFKVPVWATPFTAALVREKLREKGLEKQVRMHEVPLKHRFQLGPFGIEYVTITHSIPEPNGLAIHTPLGTVLHTGDWKIDPDPLLGETTDVTRLREIGEAGVLAMVCDSTNVFSPGESGSEAGVREEMIKVVAEQTGKVAVACFASNVARMLSAVEAARRTGRTVCLVGRSMIRIAGCARAVGLIDPQTSFVDPAQAGYLPADKVLYLCTGSQGEPRAALSQIAEGRHPHVTLNEGDSVLFSSREIPGNERAIYDLQSRLAVRGVKVVTAHDRPIHVSGHPCRDELAAMYAWVRPKVAVPTHGEHRHLVEHAKLAEGLQVPASIVMQNGAMLRLAPGAAEIIDEVPAGRLYLDGAALVAEGDVAVRDRKFLAEHGMIAVSLVVDAKGRIKSGPDVRARGIAATTDKAYELALEELADAAEAAFGKLSVSDRTDEETAEAAIAKAVRRAAERAFSKRPVVEAVVMTI